MNKIKSINSSNVKVTTLNVRGINEVVSFWKENLLSKSKKQNNISLINNNEFSLENETNKSNSNEIFSDDSNESTIQLNQDEIFNSDKEDSFIEEENVFTMTHNENTNHFDDNQNHNLSDEKSSDSEFSNPILEIINNNKNLKSKKELIKFKSSNLLLLLNSMKKNIIILTESKLSSLDQIFTFRNKIKDFTNDNFWVFCNNHGEKPKHGIITLIPKKIFKKPEHEIIKNGMVTKTTLSSKYYDFKLILISYYNPNYNKNKSLSQNIFESFSHLNNCIIAGDFNESKNYNSDYLRVEGQIQETTIKNKVKKCNNFYNISSNANFISRDFPENKFSHYTFEKNNLVSKQNIDWIFFKTT